MKKLMLGNEAVARGLYEAGVRVASSYPGTPSTEITENAAKYDEIRCEWAPNEKVAAETAAGACFAGARSFCGMKHVGLNVAADPFFTMSYIGVNGGMMLAVADDPGMHSSQNEQDSRNYAKAAKVPMLEPADSAECKRFTKLAYELSEEYDTPVVLRLTTRIAHSRSLVEIEDRTELPLKEYKKNPQKNVMLPAFAKGRHVFVEQRTEKLRDFAEKADFNRIEMNDTSIGIIAAGDCYQYAKEALGNKASYLKLGMIYPLPEKLIKDFAAKVDKLYVIEELDDFIESHCRKIGLNPIGKELFSLCGEFSQNTVKELILGKKPDCLSLDTNIPVRPPVMCCGCPHRGLFYALKKLKVYVSGDIGCYTLGASAPLAMMDTCVCMGASVSALHGFNLARGAQSEKKSVAVIGDSTFMHSGVTGLIDIAYNATNSVVIVLDNSITGMTGHQQNPTTGYTIKGDPASAVNLESLCHAVGIDNVAVCDPYNLEETIAVIKEQLEKDGPSVVISRRPCALLKYVKHNPPLRIESDKCVGCKMCLSIGCPAISIKDGKAQIDQMQCVGCGVCESLCKKSAIVE
ncbi:MULTISPECIES: indolepyruvate ferredoxin oxidoreductase subunit alpha [unclassified Ruminococcus]|uniref:indolepyruvate ferredoxin oxidoreductase subunit alpha n=1 Tax=unclassified Ruminococcus TaxID=2608920 RepID=UPI0021095F3B|nr:MULTISPECIES: indolepyruvate ferredoxin oxidoreductase subunit alpha [unclassified Ruminococcus]MCQ4022948.1 indolepyruvate ferredoxin oxidoreductase subunit alpha [Ruminococcus sp. zg-924]MCQ4115354.1 indolepyruvate ferredoxin oxidoreductase subunit alpha [Ruminococcus sp. zg-921]